MYLTRIELDPVRRETQRALSSPHVIHGSVEQGFEQAKSRRLWRIDWLHNKCYLLVLSQARPVFTHIVEQFGKPTEQPQWETKDYNILLSRLETGQDWHFRLVANPTRSSFQKERQRRGLIHAHVTTDQQKSWLLARAEHCGFTLQEDEFEVVQTRWHKFTKGNCNDPVTLRTATFEGRLAINTAESFIRALTTGIGRGKAYGCGLLTIARLNKHG